MNNRQVSFLFYFSSLISSIGSFTFNIAMIAFMLKADFHLAHASIIIALQRFVPIVVTGVWGHLTDRFPAKSTIVFAEILAAVMSAILFVLWNESETNYLIFTGVAVVRSVIVSFQIGSRTKITKLLSDSTYSSNAKHATWFNKATQGATLFSGVIAWIIISKFSFETAIILDALTFLIGGLAAILLPDLEKNLSRSDGHVAKWHQKFTDFFAYNRHAAILDIFLAVSMMGTVSFMARIAGQDQSWAALYMASFGFAVWVAGFLERGVTSKFSTSPFWIILGLGFLLLGSGNTTGIFTLLVFFIKDLAYWIIFHRLSSHIQMDTPVSRMGSVSSARMSIMVAILAAGEALVGMWSGGVSIGTETLMRASVGVGVGVYLMALNQRKVIIYDRPML